MHALQYLVQPLLALCRTAGEAISRHYHSPEADAFQSKGDDTPLTHADIAAHDILLGGLSALQPVLPVLSEESDEATVAKRRSWSRYWLVDPLDGTREFLERTGEFTVNVALIDQHRPVLGAIYLPLTGVAYVGIPGDSARRYDWAGDGSWRMRQLQVRNLRAEQPLVVLASRRHRGRRLNELLAFVSEHWGPWERDNSGSALKFCHLAEGDGDLYPRFSRCCEWDTAAGQALVEAAGGSVLGLDGAPLRYNCSESLYSPDFLAVAEPSHPFWGRLLAATAPR